MSLERPVLLYDAGCSFCRWAARVVVRLDRGERLAILPLDDVAAAPLVAQLPEDERFASWALAHRDGSFRSHLGVRGRLPDAVYGAIAGRRNLLGRLVPDGPAPRRFP